MAVWRLIVAYDGTDWSGWQRQDNAPTLQAAIEDALTTLFGGERIVLHASGRTDAGVHAYAQVATFRTDVARDPNKMRLGLNTMLPKTIAALDLDIVADSFHARFTPHRKTYRYVILDRRDRSPFLDRRAFHVRPPFDWGALTAALPAVVGTHDFTSFRGAGCNARSPVRTVSRAEHIAHGEEHWLEFEGAGFLRYQIRRMVGTLLEIGRGRRPWTAMADVVAARDKSECGRTAPPDGLYLVRVEYQTPASAAEAPRIDGSTVPAGAKST